MGKTYGMYRKRLEKHLVIKKHPVEALEIVHMVLKMKHIKRGD